MYKGISTYAAQNSRFPDKRVLSAFPDRIRRPAIAILDAHFLDADGDRWRFAGRFCGLFFNKPHLVEWHLTFRIAIPDREVKKSARRILNSFRTFWGNENTRVLICPVLEDVLVAKSDTWNRQARIIKKLTGFPVVRSSLTYGAKNKGKEERHGKNPTWQKVPKKRIYNPDGTSVDIDPAGSRYFNKMSRKQFLGVVKTRRPRIAFVWLAALQGLGGGRGFSDKPNINDRDYILSKEGRDNLKSLLSARWR